MFRHDPQHTGRSPFVGPTTPVKVWSYQTGAAIVSSPACGALGSIYVGSLDKQVYALNATGTQRWAYAAGSYVGSSPAIGTDGTVYIASMNGFLYAIDPTSSIQKWAYKTGDTSGWSSPVIAGDGTIFIGSATGPSSGSFYAIKPDGTLKWSVSPSGAITTSPAIGYDGKVYFAAGATVYSMYADTSAVNWMYSIPTGGAVAITSPTIGPDGTVYIGSNDKSLYAISATGSLKWSYPTGAMIQSSPALGTDGTVYISSQDGSLYAIDKNGRKKWSYATGAMIYASSPAIGADGVIYIGSTDGNLYALSPTGSLKWKYPIGAGIRSSPAIRQDGSIVVGADDRSVYVFAGDATTLLPTAGPGGSISPTTAQTVKVGAPVSFNATAINNYVVDSWYLDGSLAQTGGAQYTAQTTGFAVGSAHAVNVSFKYTGASQRGDWWLFHHDLQHTGRSPVLGPQTLAVKYLYSLGSKQNILSSPSFGADGTIYIGADDGNLCAYNPNGTAKWTYQTGGSISSSPAIGADGSIYFGSSDRNFYALNANGTLQWAKPCLAMNYYLSSPTIGADGTIYITDGSKHLLAFNPAGIQLWSNNSPGSMDGSPAIGTDGTIYIASEGGTLNAYSANGSYKWGAYLEQASALSSPAIGADGMIYVGAANHKLYAVSADGKLQWSFLAGDAIQATPAIGRDGTIYCGSLDGKLNAVDKYGNWLWSVQATTKGAIYSSPAIGADGTIYYGTDDQCLYAISADRTRKLSMVTRGKIRSSPAIAADGTLYVGSSDNSLYAIAGPTTSTVITPGATSYGTISPGTPQVVTIGTPVTFTATANAGYTVDSWSFDGGIIQTGGAKYIVQTTGFANASSHTVFVTFKLVANVTIVPSTGANGTINPNTTQTVTIGKSVSFTATPNTGYLVDTWTLDGNTAQVGGTSYTMFTSGMAIGSTHAVKVTFKAMPTVTLTPTVGSNGAISPSTAQTVPINTPVIFTATANAGFTVDIWTFDGNTAQTGGVHYTAQTAELTENSTHAVKVTFKVLNTVTLTPSAGSGGTISPSTAQTVIVGTAVTFTAVANSGYTTDSWTLDGTTAQTGGAQYTVSTTALAPGTTHTVMATFKYVAMLQRSDWWMAHHDPQHTGRSAAVGPQTATIKWSYTTNSWIYGSPVLAQDGTIYITSLDGNLYALKPDGTRKWFYATGSNGISSTPAIGTDGTIYFGCYDGYLYALNPDGSKLWKAATGNLISVSSPVIGTDGVIYTGSNDKSLYAFNPDGTQKWSYATGGSLFSSPALGADGTVYIGSEDDYLYAINPNGALKWSYKTGNSIGSSPAIGTDGAIYIGSDDNFLYALEPNGSKRWAFKLGDTLATCSPALGADGTIYIGSMDHSVYAVKADGTKKWSYTTGDKINSSPAISADGTIYVGSEDAVLYALTPDGTVKWSYTTGNKINVSCPVIGMDGTLYIGSTDNKLYAFAGPTNIVTLSPASGDNGLISPSAVQTVTIGSPVTFTATANAGYTVDRWTLDSNAVQTGGAQYTVQTAGYTAGSTHAIKVTFKSTTISRIIQVQNTNGVGGQPVKVSITIAADGTENAVGGSLLFDPTVLSYVTSEVGSGATGAALVVNAAQTATGSLGFALGMPAGNTLAKGTQQLLLVTFTANASSAATIGWGDQPIAREVVSANADDLPANWVSGTVSVIVGYEGDVMSEPNGDGKVTLADWVKIGRFAAGLDSLPATGGEYQHADCAPRSSKGDGVINLADWVQAGRYAAGLDPLTTAGGPTGPIGSKLRLIAPAAGDRAIQLVSTPATKAQHGGVSVVLKAQGNENTIGFSLRYDPTLCSIGTITLGSEAQNATVNINKYQMGKGQIGFAIALPAGKTLTVGRNELLKLTFTAVGAGEVKSSLKFCDAPVAREVVGVSATDLDATFVDAVITGPTK